MKNYEQFKKAKSLIEKNKIEEATALMKNLYESQPNDYGIRFEYGKILLKRQNTLEEGKNILKGLLKTSNSKYALFELGKIEYANSNYLQAKKYFKRILDIYKDDDYALLEYGRTEVKLLNLSSAEKCFEKLMQTDSKSMALLELGKVRIIEDKIDEAEELFKSLLYKQNVNLAKLELGKIEVLKGDFDTARNYFESINNGSSILELIYLDIKEGNLERAYDNYLKIRSTVINDFPGEMIKIEIYLKSKLGLLKNNYKPSSYFYEQLCDYKEEKTIEHIALHLYNKDSVYNSTFIEGTNVNELYYDIKNKISNISTNVFSITDKYVIDYDYPIGISNNRYINKIRVVTFINTKNIITAYPIELFDYQTNQSQKFEKNEEKVLKKQSQIDKFKQRYKNF